MTRAVLIPTESGDLYAADGYRAGVSGSGPSRGRGRHGCSWCIGCVGTSGCCQAPPTSNAFGTRDTSNELSRAWLPCYDGHLVGKSVAFMTR